MQHYPSAQYRRKHSRLVLSLASTALLASGCSNLVNSAPKIGNSDLIKFGGRVHGGNQPVAFATVGLYFAGQTGFGSDATLVATTTTADDGAGSFSFVRAADDQPNPGNTNTFSCPTGGGTPNVYVVARGGNTLNTHDSGVTNPASVFIAPMGLCDRLTPSTFISMSEAVTAATVAAVHQYMNVNTGSIGADGILVSYNGLTNSFDVVSNMVDLSTGQTRASFPRIGNASGVSVTATPEQAKLNQVANILSACVNTPTGASGSSSTTPNACDILFANAVPPASSATTSTPGATFNPATDVLQAAYYMFTNPTDLNTANLGRLYNLSPGSGAPYQPTLTSVPSDWSIGIRYTASGACGTGSNLLIASPYDLNVDSLGNIWIANNQGPTNSMAEISATGLPQTCQAIGGASHGGTIDSSGKIWMGDTQNNMLYRYDPLQSTPALQLLQFPTSTPPFALAADGAGNVFYSSVSPGSVWKISGAATATSAIAPVEISTNVGTLPVRLAVDGNGGIWASSRSAFVSLISPASSGVGLLGGYSDHSVHHHVSELWTLGQRRHRIKRCLHLQPGGLQPDRSAGRLRHQLRTFRCLPDGQQCRGVERSQCYRNRRCRECLGRQRPAGLIKRAWYRLPTHRQRNQPLPGRGRQRWISEGSDRPPPRQGNRGRPVWQRLDRQRWQQLRHRDRRWRRPHLSALCRRPEPGTFPNQALTRTTLTESPGDRPGLLCFPLTLLVNTPMCRAPCSIQGILPPSVPWPNTD